MPAWAKCTERNIAKTVLVNLDNVTTLVWDESQDETTITFVGEKQGGFDGMLTVRETPDQIVKAAR